MSSTAVIAIVIAAVVVLAAVAFVTAARRGDVRRGAGSLSRETRRRDRSTAPAAGRRRRRRHRPRGRAGGRGRARRRALEPAALAGAGARGRRPTPRPSASPAASSSTAASVTLMGVGLVGLRRRRASPSCGRSSAAGSARRSRVGKVDDINSPDRRRAKNALYVAEGRTWLGAVPEGGAAEGQEGLLGARAHRHGGRPRRAVPEVRAPRLPRAVLRDLAVVRVPVPRLAVQPGRREEGRPGAPRPRPLRRSSVDRRQRHRRHRHASSSARPSAPTPPARRPRARTASPRRGVTECCSPPPPRRASPSSSWWCSPARGWCTSSGTCVKAARPELGSRSSWRRTASRTTTTSSSKARGWSSSSSIGLGLLAIIAVGLPLYWLHEPTRQAGAVEDCDEHASPTGARVDFATTADGGFNCAGCHGGMKAQGGVAAYTVQDPRTGEVKRGQLDGAGAEHGAVPLLRGRGHLHPHLRPSVLADVGVGRRRRRPDERPADQQPHRVPHEHPGADGGLRLGHGPDLPERPPAHRRPRQPGAQHAGRRPGRRRGVRRIGAVQVARRGAVQPRPERRRLLVRPVPHEGLVLRRSAAVGRRRHGPEPDQRRHGPAVPERERPRRRSSRPAPRTARSTASRVRARAACPASASC